MDYMVHPCPECPHRNECDVSVKDNPHHVMFLNIRDWSKGVPRETVRATGALCYSLRKKGVEYL
jgi:hypothetical protein